MEGETVVFPKDGKNAVKNPDGSITIFEDRPEYQLQCLLIDLLCEFTELGRAIWLRREADIDWVYCIIGNEEVIVDFCCTEDRETFDIKNIDRDAPFALRYRGEILLYLGGMMNGDKLVDLIQSKDIPVDNIELNKLRKRKMNHLLDDLVEYRSSLQ